MIDQTTDSQRFKILPQEPSADELQAIMDAVAREGGVKFYYGWTLADERNFALSIESGSSIDEGCEWRMFSGDGKEAVELWYLATDDIHIIKELIREASAKNHAGAGAKGNGGSTTEAKTKDAPLSASTSPKKSLTKVRSQEPSTQTFTNLPIDETLSLLPKEELLKGNLKLVHITNLLQSIGMGTMSGRLKIQRQAGNYADIFFLNGQPVHAEGTKGSGEDLFLQVVCWSEGDFLFEPKLKTDEKSIDRSLEKLVLEGCLLLDHTNYLMKAGVRMTSVFEQTNEDLTEKEFEEAMAKGDPLDMAKMKDFYVEVDGQEMLEDIINELDLPRSQWVPLVSNLLRQKVIDLCAVAEQGASLVHPKDINSSLVESVRQGLISEKTGIFTYAALLYLLGVQIKCSSMPLSVLLIELRSGVKSGKATLSSQQVQELSFKVDKLTSSRNIFAHYEENEFAVVLLGVRAEKAARIAERLVKTLESSGLETGESSMLAAVGVASHPEDAQDLGSLLGEAEHAKQQAAKMGAGVCLANE